jgi:ribulose-phosphate 3-epimerase
MILIAPSMLSADFLHLEKDVEMVNKYADIFHLDIMDGTFVPNISYGFPVVEAIASIARKPLDVHLMIVNPENYIERFAKLGT